MALGSFKPNNKGKFAKEGGKRAFPPEWYAAQAARRKKKADGTYKEGKHKESTKADRDLTLEKKPKRQMPKEWHEKQLAKAKERKDAEAKGEYERKKRGKLSEYKDKDIAPAMKEKRRVSADSHTQAQQIFNSLNKGDTVEVKTKTGDEVVKILGYGVLPMTKRGINSKGLIRVVDTNNLLAAYL